MAVFSKGDGLHRFKRQAKFVPARIVDFILDKTVHADKRELTVELIFCQGGDARKNAGDNELDHFGGVFEPALSTALRHLPGAKAVAYLDRPMKEAPEGLECKILKPPFTDDHPRYGWRFSDWARGIGLLRSEADAAIYLDSDMAVVSGHFNRLAAFALRFGFCAPMNPRLLVKDDAVLGQDGLKHGVTDPTGGLGFAFNTAPMAVNPRDPRARALLAAYVQEMEARAIRSPLALWRAAWATGVTPCMLPPQWCVSEQWEGVGDEVVLHLGHKTVASHYGWASV